MLFVKLDKNNSLLWKNMIIPIIIGHNLEGFILGTEECPPEFTETQVTKVQEDGSTGTAVEVGQNPGNNKWITTD